MSFINLIDLTSTNGNVSIPVNKITGVCETSPLSKSEGHHSFVATGPDDPDGGENGWYVAEEFYQVRAALDDILASNLGEQK